MTRFLINEVSGRPKKIGVSILIPAYNASKTIGSTLLSAILFRPRGCEILVYLDGGQTRSRIMDFAENQGWITVFKGEHQLGLAHALNFLLSKARMPMVARLDSDDLALPFYIKRALKKMRTSGVDIVFSNAIFFGKAIKWTPILPQPPYGIGAEQTPKFLTLGNPFVHPTMVASRDALLNVGGYKDTVAEDYELWIRSTLAGLRICRIWGFGVLYRIHAGQVTSKDNYRYLVDNSLEIKNQVKALISKIGYTVNDDNILDVKAMISLDLQSTIWSYRLDLAVRRLFERHRPKQKQGPKQS